MGARFPLRSSSGPPPAGPGGWPLPAHFGRDLERGVGGGRLPEGPPGLPGTPAGPIPAASTRTTSVRTAARAALPGAPCSAGSGPRLDASSAGGTRPLRRRAAWGAPRAPRAPRAGLRCGMTRMALWDQHPGSTSSVAFRGEA